MKPGSAERPALTAEVAPPAPVGGIVLGAGVDIVEVERVVAALGRHGERFLERLFRTGEQEPGRGGRTWVQRLAGRFAAKEAVLKALGTGLRRCRWRDVEVVRAPSGRPAVRLHGPLNRTAAELGVAEVWVSISHGRRYAVAVAVAVGPGPAGEAVASTAGRERAGSRVAPRP